MGYLILKIRYFVEKLCLFYWLGKYLWYENQQKILIFKDIIINQRSIRKWLKIRPIKKKVNLDIFDL